MNQADPNQAVRNIVVALRDQSSGDRAARRAFAIARAGRDIVHLVHVERLANWRLAAELMQPRWMSPGEAEAQERDQWLNDIAAVARTAGHRVEVHVRSGAPGKEIAACAEEVGADLIVVAGPRDSLVREMFVGSTASKILRSAPCPVLVSRSDANETETYRSVMLSVDPEHEEMAYKVVQQAAAFFDRPQYHLAHAYRVPEEHVLRMRGASEEEIADLRKAMVPRYENELRPLADSLPGVELHVEHGFPSSVLLDLCERLKPDIMVIGKHRGSDMEERVLGSVTQFLLYACTCDMLLIG